MSPELWCFDNNNNNSVICFVYDDVKNSDASPAAELSID